MMRTVTKILDGDTFEIGTNIDSLNKIRLARVRAPEKGTKYGTIATNTLRGLIGGKLVRIEPVSRSYDRIVAEVYYNSRNINNVMRDKGYTNHGR